jgi:hypothetical protein
MLGRASPYFFSLPLLRLPIFTALLSSTVLSYIPAVIVLCTMLSRLPRNSSLHAAMLRRTGQVKMGMRLTKGL